MKGTIWNANRGYVDRIRSPPHYSCNYEVPSTVLYLGKYSRTLVFTAHMADMVAMAHMAFMDRPQKAVSQLSPLHVIIATHIPTSRDLETPTEAK